MKQRQIFDKYPHFFVNSAENKPSTNHRKNEHYDHVMRCVRASKDPEPGNDLYDSMKPLIFLGRLALIIPCCRDDADTFKDSSFSWRKIFTLLSIFLATWLFIVVIFDAKLMFQLGSLGGLGALSYVSNAHLLAMSSNDLLVCIHFLRHTDKFYCIFEKWSEFALVTDFVHDKWLKPMAYFSIITCLVPIAVTTTFLAEVLSRDTSNLGNASSDMSPLEKLFGYLMYSWTDLFPYNPYFVAFYTVMRIWSTLSRSFISPLLIFFSRALSFQFKKLIENGIGTNIEDAHFVNLNHKDKVFWINLVRKHQAISILVKVINNFLSPLIFWWTAKNIYEISIQLFRAWQGSSTGVKQVGMPTYFFIVGFMLEVLQFLLTILCATKVHTNAMKILIVLEKCPKEHYSDTGVERLERKMRSDPHIGFTGWGCFIISKSFLLKLFNAIFTMEIVLLQAK